MAETQKLVQQLADLEKYRRVFYATPDYCSFSNLATGTFIDVNPGFEKMIGFKREEVIGRTSFSIGLWPYPEERDAMLAMLRVQNQIPLYSAHFRTRTDEIILIEASIATFELNGEMILVAVVRDVTTRKKEEEELRRYRTKLEQLVEQRTVELRQAMERVRDLAVHDELTGVGNRRELIAQFERERGIFNRTRLDFCIAILDLDHFKSINDELGHAIGDQVIKTFADLLQHSIRASDCIARYGGDEFVLLLRGTNLDGAIILLRRLCTAVAGHDWAKIAPGKEMTTSVGVAMFYGSETLDDILKRADAALYAAKQAGRNRVCSENDIA